MEKINLLEAFLFVSNQPVKMQDIKKILKMSEEEILKAVELLNERYRGTSLQVYVEGDSLLLDLKEMYGEKVKPLVTTQALSKRAIRFLSFIASKPRTMTEIRRRFSSKFDELMKEVFPYIKIEKMGRKKIVSPSERFYREFEVKRK